MKIQKNPGKMKVRSNILHLMGLVLALIFVLSVAQTDAAPQSGTITGTVFRDFNANGENDSGEPGISGIIVTAYDTVGAIQGTATTIADGTYSLNATGTGPYRIEFTGAPSYLQFGAIGADSNSSVQFITDGNTANVDMGLNNPADYNQAAPDVSVSVMTNGDQTAGNPSIRETSSITNIITTTTTVLDTATGSIWGLAYHRESDTLFSAAFLKRHVGFGAGGMDTIYATDSNNTTATFVELTDDLGISVGAEPTGRGLGAPGQPNYDVQAYSLVGKRGLGDIDYDENSSTLWVVNLGDGRLYGIENIDPATTPVIADVLTDNSNVLGFDINTTPAITCNNGQLRPFAIKIQDDKVYVGAVCSGEDIGAVAADLDAHILSLDLNNTNAGFSEIISFSLDYIREKAIYGGSLNWLTWYEGDTAYQTYWGGSHTQALLTDIEIDNDGSLILGISDRFGHQSGPQNYAPDPTETDTTLTPADHLAMGEILRVCKTNSGYFLEGHVNCLNDNPRPATEDTDNAGSASRGPGSGEYYVGDWGPQDADEFSETTTGGLAMMLGSSHVMVTGSDPVGYYEGGIRWLDNNDGHRAGSRAIYNGLLPYFAKGSGIGDIELLSDPAPLEIGNRLWCDADNDGLQGPSEGGVSAGITVTMTCGANSATVTTDANGNYLFTDTIWETANSGAMIPRNTSCTLSIENSSGSANETSLIAACGGAAPSPADQTPIGDGNDDIRDSDGSQNGSVVEVTFTTGRSGHNNHTYDFGFAQARIDWGDLPDASSSISTSFPTTHANNGPHHHIVNNLYLGACVDAESDGAPDPEAGMDGVGGDDGSVGTSTAGTCATANDDEDGVSLITPMVAGQQACVSVTAANSTGSTAKLQGWIDFNSNGAIDSGEELTTGDFAGGGADITNGGVTAQSTCFTVPAAATFDGGETYLRWRLSSAGNLTEVGAAADGEVEDYHQPLACLGNYVWHDFDKDGVQGPTEDGINGVVVNAIWAGPDGDINTAGDNVTYSMTTMANAGADGHYHFCGLLPGETLQVNIPTPPAAFTQATGLGAGTATTDSDGTQITVGASVTGPIVTVPSVDYNSSPVLNWESGEGSTGDSAGLENYPDTSTNVSIDFGFSAEATAVAMAGQSAQSTQPSVWLAAPVVAGLALVWMLLKRREEDAA